MQKNSTSRLSCITQETKTPVTHSLIWLHGLGADGNDFVPFITELQLPQTLGMRFIFPHAPLIPVTLNNGYVMRAWYDIVSLSKEEKHDAAGIEKSIALIQELIDAEVERGIATDQIMLAGFSQGAVIALHTALRYKKPLAGVIALSGYLPFAETLLKQTSKANHERPIFMAHGTEDNVVPYMAGEAAYLALKKAGFAISWHAYPIAHTVCEAEVRDISQWIQSIF